MSRMSETQEPAPQLITPAELARTLRLTVRTLENWRLRNWGPPYIRLGTGAHNKVVYAWHAVDAWLETLKRP